MDTFVVTWRELLILVVLVLTVYVAEMLLLMRAGGALRKPRWLSIIEEKTYEAELRQQIEELQARLTALEVNSVPLRAAPVPPAPYTEAKKPEPPPPVVKPAGDKAEPPAAGQQNLTAFQRAVRMAANGASAGELVGKCGISQSEADMIVALHKP